MLTTTKLRILSPGQWARVRVPDYEHWRKEPYLSPGDQVDGCLMPPLPRPRYGCPNYVEWHYRGRMEEADLRLLPRDAG